MTYPVCVSETRRCRAPVPEPGKIDMNTTRLYAYDEIPRKGDFEPNLGKQELVARYEEIAWSEALRWETHYRREKLLGAGGQGAVYLAQRLGCDGFARPVALKAFSPETYHSDQAYIEDMARVGQVSSRVAVIQCDNVVHIHDFVDWHGIRLMEMEWLDGFDLREVLTARMFDRTREQVTPERWRHVNSVILAPGPSQPRLKPGVAISILRDCLAGLAALHGAGIVHSDIKPANIMLTRTGNAKLIDIGSTIDLRRPSPRRVWSPAYAAPEVLKGGEPTSRSDLASMGYCLVEMLAGRPVFEGKTTYPELVEAKSRLHERLSDLLPPEVSCNELLMNLCQRLINPDPSTRVPTAEAADVGRRGAADFHRQLVKGNLASEYEHDIRTWLRELVT
jgi:eukaryotic-like serine/threonine-protein kinase